MSDRSVTHDTFVLERVFPASPARVFRAFADPEAKAAWFTSPEGWRTVESSMDFRVGGGDVSTGGPDGGPHIEFFSQYQDIVTDERIVYTYFMVIDGNRISVSLATIELEPVVDGTRLVLTEQGAYLDSFDKPEVREHGTNDLLDKLGAYLLT